MSSLTCRLLSVRNPHRERILNRSLELRDVRIAVAGGEAGRPMAVVCVDFLSICRALSSSEGARSGAHQQRGSRQVRAPVGRIWD